MLKISNCLIIHLTLATIIKLPLIHSLSNFISVEQRIVKLCSKKIMKVLRKEELIEMKDTIVDFLYRLKDRHPFSTSSSFISSLFGFQKYESFDVAYRVMNFMRDNNLKPSNAQIEKYRQSKTTKIFNLLPSKEELKEKINMDEYRYNDMKKAYRRKIIKIKWE